MRHTMRALACGALIVLGACSTAAQPSRQMAPDTVVATIGSARITLAEVDEQALQQRSSDYGNSRLVQALYLARREALEEIVSDRLIAQEAKSLGIDLNALLQREVIDASPPPTDADIEQWYQANPTQVQGAPLGQVREPIRTLLSRQRMNDARLNFIERLKAKTPVAVMLEPPRQTIATAGHAAKGPKEAPIELVEFSDFECPFCQRANPTVQQVLQTYGDRIRFVYRHYPLANHPHARPAAEAAACANEQDRFWPYHDQLFANPAKLTDEDLKAHAAAVGLDTAAFNACFSTRKLSAAIDQDVKEANEAGVTGTPAFFVNGRPLDGAQPFERFKVLIDEELALKKR